MDSATTSQLSIVLKRFLSNVDQCIRPLGGFDPASSFAGVTMTDLRNRARLRHILKGSDASHVNPGE